MAEPNGSWRPQVRVTPSPRRRRTVAARLVDGVLEVRVPAWMSVAEREKWAERMRDYPLPSNVWRIAIAGDGDALRKISISGSQVSV